MAKQDEPNWGYFLGVGLQICVGAGLGYAVGFWLGQRYGWKHAPVIGFAIGFAGGMYLLIKDVLRMNKD
jgi:hypothetical protein